MIKKHKRNITGFIRKVYCGYFGGKMGDQDKSWASHKECYVSAEGLRKWSKGKKKEFRFGVPVIWREPKNRSDICCICFCDVKGHNCKNKKVILYPNLPLVLRPVVRGPEVPVTQSTEILEDASTNSCDSSGDDEEFQCHTERQGHNCSLSLN
jgi:hypothetical protein